MGADISESNKIIGQAKSPSKKHLLASALVLLACGALVSCQDAVSSESASSESTSSESTSSEPASSKSTSNKNAAGEYLVEDQEAYKDAVKNAKPGDVIRLKDGTWEDFEILFTGKGEKLSLIHI